MAGSRIEATASACSALREADSHFGCSVSHCVVNVPNVLLGIQRQPVSAGEEDEMLNHWLKKVTRVYPIMGGGKVAAGAVRRMSDKY